MDENAIANALKGFPKKPADPVSQGDPHHMGWPGRLDASKKRFKPHARINDYGYRPDEKK
jgi:hypothetical protein